jgi:hypothetical protein
MRWQLLKGLEVRKQTSRVLKQERQDSLLSFLFYTPARLIQALTS